MSMLGFSLILESVFMLSTCAHLLAFSVLITSYSVQLEKVRSPLLRDLMLFLKELMKDYKVEINGMEALHSVFVLCAQTHTVTHSSSPLRVTENKHVYTNRIFTHSFLHITYSTCTHMTDKHITPTLDMTYCTYTLH